MSLFKLDLDTQTFIIVITSIIWAMNFRFTFNNINYHMDIGNYCSLKYDPFLILIKNILCIFYFLPYFIELKLNKINISQQNLNIENNENDENENLDEIEAKIVPNQLNNNNKKNFFVLKILLFLIFIYFSEEIYFIISNNHVLDRTVCPTRNMFTLIAILIFSPILSKKKIDKAQIKNFLNYNRHQIIPLIIIFLLSLFIPKSSELSSGLVQKILRNFIHLYPNFKIIQNKYRFHFLKNYKAKKFLLWYDFLPKIYLIIFTEQKIFPD